MTVLTNKEFTAKLSGVIKSAKTQRDNIQVLIESGLAQANEHGQLTQLSVLLNSTIGVRSLNTKAIKEYVQAHAEVVWVKSKDKKSMQFKKVKGSELVGAVEEITVPWYEHEAAAKNQAKADMDVMAQAKVFLTRLSKAVEAGSIKEGQEEKAQEIKQQLASLLA